MFTALLPIGIQIIGFLFKRLGARKETIDAYYQLCRAAQKEISISVKMNKSYKEQMKRVEGRFKKGKKDGKENN